MRLNVIKAKLNSKQHWQQLSFCGGSPGKLKGLRTLQIKLLRFIVQLTVSDLSHLFISSPFPPPPLPLHSIIKVCTVSNSTDLFGQCHGAGGGCCSLVAMDTLHSSLTIH